MSFVLKYKRTDGTVVTCDAESADNPFEARTRAAVQVLMIFVDEGHRIAIGDAKRFGCLVRDAELGADVLHEPSGLVFRTVESEAW